MGTASSPSVDLLSNHGCGSDSRHLMALFQGRFSVDGNCWLSRGHHSIVDPHCFGLLKDVKSCTVI